MGRVKNPKYESMSLEELKANMEKSRQELEVAIHNKNLLEQRKKVVERRERSHRLISKIVISEPQEKDGTENYRRTPETVTMEIHFNLKPIPELGTIERGSGSHKLKNLSKFNLF